MQILVGLGDPIEGTGWLDSVGRGSVFINPKFTGERQNELVKHGKPTSRKLSSQIPYAEKYIGAPYVLTIDTSNLTEVRLAVKAALKRQVGGFLCSVFFISTSYCRFTKDCVE